MIRTVLPGELGGTVDRVMTSKSQAHRLMICAAQAEEETLLTGVPPSEDAEATLGCLQGMGALLRRTEEGICLRKGKRPDEAPLLDCGESGSTLRFLLPLAAAAGIPASFTGRGKLASRPLSPLYEEMAAHGAVMSAPGSFPLRLSGTLRAGTYRIPGSVSSQFISGLMMALPLLREDSCLEIGGRLESGPYVELTEETLGRFGVRILREEARWIIPGGQRFRSPGTAAVEGDWSGAAFWLAAGALSEKGVRVRGVRAGSAQGDREMVTLLRRFGAEIEQTETEVQVRKGKLRGMEIDAADIPDLVPVLAVVAAFALGPTRIRNIRRLRLKESDRVASVLALIRSLGGRAEAEENEMTIEGTGSLRGGRADAFGDHRIAMAAAVAGTGTDRPVHIVGAEAVSKSYPGFFEQFTELGGRMEA